VGLTTLMIGYIQCSSIGLKIRRVEMDSNGFEGTGLWAIVGTNDRVQRNSVELKVRESERIIMGWKELDYVVIRRHHNWPFGGSEGDIFLAGRGSSMSG
jgi:hypothetical protein